MSNKLHRTPQIVKIEQYLFDGYTLGFATIGAVIFLELTNINTIKKIIKNQGFHHYLMAWLFSLINTIFIGPNIYGIVSYFWIDKSKHNILQTILNVNKILIIHSFGYWQAHNLMHHRKFFIEAHKFHHTYSSYVTPIVANAVSINEYGLAYMLPFIVASILIKPTNLELQIGGGIVSICNLIIHCPSLIKISPYYPNWFVSPDKHLIHHKTKNASHKAASTFDLDYIFNKINFINN
jgi:sterol desaturase/sphingolipid hydroxylase (fatty acid hydroxylase superfamily)